MKTTLVHHHRQASAWPRERQSISTRGRRTLLSTLFLGAKAKSPRQSNRPASRGQASGGLPKQSTWSWYLYDGKAVSHSLGERASFDVTMKLPSCVCVDDDVVVGGVGAMTRALLEGISEVRGITGLTTEMGGRFAVNISSRNLIPRLSESAIDICCGASSSCLLPYCSSILSCNEQART